jgi:hypothetical protein
MLTDDCQDSTCATSCNAGFTACALSTTYACANLQTDPAHCGACGTACTSSQVCDAGQCVPYLPASGCWECGNGNALPLCCPLDGQTICTNAAACP